MQGTLLLMTANKYCIGDGDFPSSKHYARVHIKVRG
jgi:hypothetical protein